MPHYSAEQQCQQHYCERLTAALGAQYQGVYIVALHHTSHRQQGRARAALHARAEFLV